jgi:phenylpropionate dioxygenase-like ring-hydroxylating dioxygenase large terminal subunit
MDKKYSGWFAICRSKELKKSIFRFTIQGISMIAFRSKDGEALALLDACCHRQTPLSKGKIVNGLVECPYHGWEFNHKGICQKIPGLPSDKPCSQ